MFGATKLIFGKLPPFVHKKKPAQRPHVKLPNHYFTLLIQSVLKPTQIVEFLVPTRITKPEIKEYLQNYYQLPVKSVTTVNYEGKRYYNLMKKGRSIAGAYKKAYVHMRETITVDWNEEVKTEIERYYDRKKNKELKKQQKENQDIEKKQNTETETAPQ
eukprot:gene11606-4849_t